MSIHKKIFSLVSANLLMLSSSISNISYSNEPIQLPKLISDFEKNQVDDNTDGKPLENTITDRQVLLNSIKEDIKLNSQFFQTDKSYTFKNKINQQTNKPFKTKEEIIENEFFKDNPIETFRTTVNPLDLKSIKDTEFGLLNEQLVKYGFNLDDYIKIFRTQSGRFVLANGKVGSEYTVPENIQDKDEQAKYKARNFALDSYINQGLVRPKYSYTGKDGEWYDSNLTAKEKFNDKLTQAAVDNGKVKSSLFYYYYYYDGVAYNAFSKDDIEELKDQLTEGIHFDSFEDEKASNYKLFPSFAADEDKFWENFGTRLYQIFDANITKIVKYETDIRGNFRIKSGKDGDGSETTLTKVTSTSDGVKINKKNRKEFEITISNNMRGKFDEKRFKEFGSMGVWSKSKDWKSSPCHVWEKASSDYKFKEQKLSISLDKSRYPSDFCWARSYPDSISNNELDVSIGTVTNKNIKLSREKTGDKTWDGLVETFSDFLTENKKEYTINYETLANEIVNLKGAETAEIETIKSDIRKKQDIKIWRDDVKIKIFDKIFKQLKDIVIKLLQNRKLDGKSHFLNDIVDNYSETNKQYVFSLIEENRKFKKILEQKITSKEDILSVNDLNISGVENQKSIVFKTSKENWQQFNYFNKEKMQFNIALRQKWFIYDGENPKDTKIKDIINIEQSVLDLFRYLLI